MDATTQITGDINLATLTNIANTLGPYYLGLRERGKVPYVPPSPALGGNLYCYLVREVPGLRRKRCAFDLCESHIPISTLARPLRVLSLSRIFTFRLREDHDITGIYLFDTPESGVPIIECNIDTVRVFAGDTITIDHCDFYLHTS